MEEQFQPVDQLAGRGLLLEAGHLAHLVEDVHRLSDQHLLDAREMDVDDRLHRLPVGEFDVVEEAAAKERVGQFLLVVRGDDDDRPLGGLYRLLRLVDVELHPIELLEEIVGKFDVGLVDLVDE